MSGRNIGKNIGPFDSGKSIFDFLDAPTLNKIAKAVNQYSNLTVRAPLQLQRGAHGDTLSLAGRIDNFLFVQLTEDLIIDSTATANILKRDKDDNLSEDSEAAGTITVFNIGKIKCFDNDIGLALKNPFSKNSPLEFIRLSHKALFIRGKISQDLTTGMSIVTISEVTSFAFGSDPEENTVLTTVNTPQKFVADSGAIFQAHLTDDGTYEMTQIDCAD